MLTSAAVLPWQRLQSRNLSCTAHIKVKTLRTTIKTRDPVPRAAPFPPHQPEGRLCRRVTVGEYKTAPKETPEETRLSTSWKPDVSEVINQVRRRWKVFVICQRASAEEDRRRWRHKHTHLNRGWTVSNKSFQGRKYAEDQRAKSRSLAVKTETGGKDVIFGGKWKVLSSFLSKMILKTRCLHLIFQTTNGPKSQSSRWSSEGPPTPLSLSRHFPHRVWSANNAGTYSCR